MTIARVRPVGLWIDGSTVSPAEWEAFDANLAEAVDGRGGAYILTETLEFGGADVVFGDNVDVGADLTVGSALQVSGNAYMFGDFVAGLSDADTFTVEATASFLSPATFAGAVTFGDLVIAEADWTFEQDVDVGGALTAAGSVTVAGAFDANGNCYLGGASGFVEVLGVTTVRETISFGGDGKIAWRQAILATDANASVIAAQVDSVFLANGVWTAPHVVSIDDTGATDGMRITFRTEDTTHSMAIAFGPTIGALVGNGNWGYAERVGGAWKWHLGNL